jgi:3-deoxy-D-manno-octulosonic acid hydroxylase-like protein
MPLLESCGRLWSLMIYELNRRQWRSDPSPTNPSDVTDELESGAVIVMPRLPFEVEAGERRFFTPAIAAAKNVSFDPAVGRVSGARLDAASRDGAPLAAMLRRFSDASAALVGDLFPAYAGRLERARTSFRPAEIAGRSATWRHDDTRLHIDSFPATPVHGRRILRVFTNVNPDGKVRAWRVGEPFEAVASRFAPALPLPLPGSAALLRLARITKSRRSAYDALMLRLHDRMKGDVVYQASAPQTPIDFPAGATWLAFTDCVSHAAMSGQYQLEQTFLLPVDAMRRADRSPLRILERIKQRTLI